MCFDETADTERSPSFVQIVLHREEDILKCECEMCMVHSLLSRIPQDLPLEQLICYAGDLFVQYPPPALEADAKRHYERCGVAVALPQGLSPESSDHTVFRFLLFLIEFYFRIPVRGPDPERSVHYERCGVAVAPAGASPASSDLTVFRFLPFLIELYFRIPVRGPRYARPVSCYYFFLYRPPRGQCITRGAGSPSLPQGLCWVRAIYRFAGFSFLLDS